ncbi:MAG TPA: serine/threonine-protein kinase, partial [Candidatus Cybelea sp.]|nr:serine/threonine-protein kinase [Candidatus Cybelea sp.]
SAFLRAACGGNAELQANVEALLRAHLESGEFLEQAPAEVKAQTKLPGEKAGDWVGRYKLLQQIGEGGCGVVFMAEQEEPVRRKVAVKIVKPGMDTKMVIARFEAERQALALMDHPNIAHVLDAGATQGGRPYFVMELVRGVKITDYCNQDALKTAARLEMFVEVCDAVQHAHQKGIIHRDLKPSNILVTTLPSGKPQVKVIDFGIAKATTGQRLTDKTLFTAFELLIGTPAYMSPEQAALSSVDVDTRSDIYSLGVLLYELLTGSTPFDTTELLKRGLDEVRRVVCDVEPPCPSTRLSTLMAADLTSVSRQRQVEAPRLIREVRGDLDWMVMKALEKDRARRYATVNGFAADIRRHLAGEAIAARPPSTLYRLKKLFTRNKLLFCSIGIIFLLLSTALIVTSRLLIHERFARQEADLFRMEALADKLEREGKRDEGLNLRLDALKVRAKLYGSEAPPPFDSIVGIAETLIRQSQHDRLESVLNTFLTPAALRNPRFADVIAFRAHILACRGKWAEALPDALRVLEYRPAEANTYHSLAPLLVATTNLDAYRALCPKIVARFRGVTDASSADQVAKDCLILPASGADLPSVAAMAETAVTAGKGMGVYPLFQCCKALAEYRQGHWPEAISLATNAVQNSWPYSRSESWAILAMSEYRLNQMAAARADLARCEQVVQDQMPRFGDVLGYDWRDWIIAHSLLAEARNLIQSQTPPSKSLPFGQTGPGQKHE